ncbi:hypothetical protein [Frigoribacterium faeni]|jgi:hypothetical protein|uniref:hypothetical protein n=1 Tax=Frigoribacterium faeni TaxID=145483 RepID=UPI00141BD698|nr:hypothetical protein [Frigoribacterium faeni]NIJ06338.1 hypothetical protein [Frigoribacterium faeni]
MRPLFTSYRVQGFVGVVLLAASGTLFLAARLLYVYKGATYKCAVEGPYLDHSSIETQLVSGSFSAWPLGRECTYMTASVIETARGAADAWILTWLTYGPAALGLLLVIGVVKAALIRRGRAA